MARSAERRWTPSEGRATPLSSDGVSIAHTLKSDSRSLNGETEKRMSVRRFASACHFPISAAV